MISGQDYALQLARTVTVCLLFLAGTVSLHAQTDEHKALVARARAGQAESVLPKLEAIARVRPDDPLVQADLIVVMHWAGQDQNAIEHLANVASLSLPDYLASFIIRIAVGLRNYEPAISALKAIQLRSTAPWPIELEIDRLRLIRQSGDAIGALVECNQLLAVYPAASSDNDQLLREKALIASALAAHSIAMDIARARPDLFSSAQLLAIEQDWQAQRVKVGTAMQSSRDDRLRLAVSDAAISSGYQALEANDANSSLFERSRYDQLVALRDRRAMKEAIELFNAIEGKVPNYASLAAADAFLAERQPLRAAQLYQHSLLGRSGEATWETKVNLAYAFLEAEQQSDALAVIGSIRDEINVELAPGSPREYDHGIRRWRMRAELTLANFERFTNQHERAALRLRQLLEWMPFDAEIRLAMADSLSNRQYPRQASKLIERVASDFPDSLQAQLAQVSSALELGDIRHARELLERLEQRLGEHPRLESLRRELNHESSGIARLAIGWTLGESSEALRSPPRERRIQASVESPMLGDHWRLMASALQQQALRADGKTDRRRYGLGASARWPNLTVAAALTAGPANTVPNKNGSWWRLSYALDDQWTVRLRVDRQSDDVPLRAYSAGISLNTVALEIEWRHFEYRTLALGYERGRLTDGNERDVWAAGWRERWYDSPALVFSTHLGLGQSSHSQTDTPYFSPARFFDVSFSFIAEQTLGRHYNASWRHRLTLAPGYFEQQGYAARFGHTVRYEHELEARSKSMRVSLAQSRRPYDGVVEGRWLAAIELTSRF